MSGYKLCVAGGPIYEAQKTVTQLRHLGCRLHAARTLPALGGQALGLQRDMLALAEKLTQLSSEIWNEAVKVVVKL